MDDLSKICENTVHLFNTNFTYRKNARLAWEYCGLEPNNKPLNECNIGIALEHARKEYGDILTRPEYAPPIEANQNDETKNLVHIFFVII